MAKKARSQQKEKLFEDKLVPAKKGSNELFEVSYSDDSQPVECLGMTFENDAARRAYFLEQLREKLKDPEFRKIEGFPLGEDEDILALSDPPYYTACPNPFLADFINSHTNAQCAEYKREPFAVDVSEGKYHPFYKLHPYPTKVPHQAIMRFILHYTDPGDVVLDGFCGTGMTALAGMLCADREAVSSLGYSVSKDGALTDTTGRTFSALGPRPTIVCDISPAATFIAYNYNTPIDSSRFQESLESLLADACDECGWMYATLHRPDRKQVKHALEQLSSHGDQLLRVSTDLPWGEINYVAWSDVFICPECASEVVFWDVAVDVVNGKIQQSFNCPSCNVELSKRNMQRAWTTVFDKTLNESVTHAKQAPVLISYSFGGSRFQKSPDEFDTALITYINQQSIPHWHPSNELPDGFNTAQPKGSHGYTHVHQFYSRRNLWTLASFASRVNARDGRFSVTRVSGQVTQLYRFTYQSGVWGAGGGPLSGTLYVPSLVKELAVGNQLAQAIRDQSKVRSLPRPCEWCVTTQSSTNLSTIPASSIDYIFVDPPFGGNLMYSELASLWDCWLKVWTNNSDEAIVDQVQDKQLDDYEDLMTACFREFCRVLKPGRWMTVEFHNSQNAVWNAIQESLQRAGFVVADVRTLDKKKGTVKQTTGAGAVKQDLIISAYRPNGGLEERFQLEAGTEAGVWDFLDTHLRQLPVFVSQDGRAEILAERQKYLLFDRMVAFHVQRGVTVPLSAAEFYLQLLERYPERDGMYFVADQVAEYDKCRMSVAEVVQLELFISDEATAIQWLKQQIGKKPQTFSDLQPQFMKEIGGWGKHEKSLELSEILEQNFLSYDGKGEVPSQVHSYLSTNFHELRNLDKDDPKLIAKAKNRWYVPDPRKEADLEKIRHRALMKEFDEYRESKGKLKVVRTEALRAGFKDCWQTGDYQTIVSMAKRVKDDIIQEDPALLMYYDNASVRVGD